MLLAQVTHEDTSLFAVVVNDSAVDLVLLNILAYGAPLALVAVVAVVIVAVVHASLLAVQRHRGVNLVDNTVGGVGDYVI